MLKAKAFENRAVSRDGQLTEPPGLRRVSPGRAAIAVFVDEVDAPWLKILKPGFRHVLAVIEDGSSWLLCDPKKDRIDLRRLDPPAGFDLAGFYAERGHIVLAGEVLEDLPRQAFAAAPLTCVAVVKRLLGVRAAHVLTPYQLFRHLLVAHPVPFELRGAAGRAAPDAAHGSPVGALAPAQA